MKLIVEDILYCLKLAAKIFIIPFTIGIIIGIFMNGFNLRGILLMGCSVVQWLVALGLAICAISFMKPKHMRPLNYENEWKMYFKKFNLAGAIFFICFFMGAFSLVIDFVVKTAI